MKLETPTASDWQDFEAFVAKEFPKHVFKLVDSRGKQLGADL